MSDDAFIELDTYFIISIHKLQSACVINKKLPYCHKTGALLIIIIESEKYMFVHEVSATF